jgi:hypothetical protein
MGAAEVEAALAFHEAQMRERGLAIRRFAPACGEVLLWHASLIHGGAPVTLPGSTRKSFVVHYSTARTYRERSITLSEADGAAGAERRVVWATSDKLAAPGATGFDNPLRGRPRD